MTDEELFVAVTLAAMPGDERIHREVAEFGIQDASSRWIAGMGPEKFCERWKKVLTFAPRVLESGRRRGFRFITPQDEQWPVEIQVLDELAPLALWIKGQADLSALSASAISIVGARSSTSYGERIASTMASYAAGIGVTVVSGAAFGIDAAAHRGALANAGPTIAVLACGVDVAYPASHDTLLARIAETGLVISEHAPGQPPRKPGFLVRNRLIAALGHSTVVVEAAMRSGTLSTSTWANDIGKKVWGVPGQISSPTSVGVHVGIAQGTMSVLVDIKDPFAAMGPTPVPLGDSEKLVLSLVLEQSMTTDEMVNRVRTQVNSTDTIAALALLEFSGLIVRQADYWVRAS